MLDEIVLPTFSHFFRFAKSEKNAIGSFKFENNRGAVYSGCCPLRSVGLGIIFQIGARYYCDFRLPESR